MKTLSLIAALLLFMALFNLPHIYYTFLRVVITIACGIIAVNEYESRNHFWCVVFVLMALLFNPLVPVHLYGRARWIPINIVCGTLFIVKAHISLRTHKEH